MLDIIVMLDEQALLWIQENLRTEVGDVLMPIWSSMGNFGAVFILSAGLMLPFRRTRRAGTLALGSMLLGLVTTNLILKNLVARTRPWFVVEGLETLLRSADLNSFPSGHTCAAFAFATALCMNLDDLPWARRAAVLAAVLMGFSRVYVGVHFPTDVLAGAGVGSLCGLTATLLYRRHLQARFPLGGSPTHTPRRRRKEKRA